MNERSLTNKQLIKEICAMRRFALDLIEKYPDKDYIELLSILISRDYYYKEGLAIPSVKQIIAESGLSNSKINKYLNEIYSDLKGDDFKFNIPEIKYIFFISSFGNYLSKEFSSLPRVPRIGERIEFSYFKEELRLSSFYVDNVCNSFTDSTQTVEIFLKIGDYNLHWKLRKDEARENGELGWMEFWDDDHKLKEKLNYGVYKYKR